ncbi:MAG: carbon-nitrogen hydrolase family protein [Fimbriiglobus sp.]
MTSWKIAGVQMDCKLRGHASNLAVLRERLAVAAGEGAKLVVFPECAMTGYGFTARQDLAAIAEQIPGTTTETLSADCVRLGVWAIYGTIEANGDKLYNTAVLLGPTGQIEKYRKTHLPCVGADRFTDPGEGPLRVFDLGGLRIGILICFDGSFPEAARTLTLLGADLIALPTNWADKAFKMATLVPKVRAFENHIYFLAVNRVGVESGYHYIGHSSLSDPVAEVLASADHDQEAILYGTVDPAVARATKMVHCVGEYEIDRVAWRRPDLYGPLTEGPGFPGHKQK